MVSTYAIIQDNTVINRIVADEEFMLHLGGEYTNDPSAQIGRTLIDGVWTPPAVEEE